MEAYMKAQGMFHTADQPDAEYSEIIELDMASVMPSLAGPKRPQDRVLLSEAADNYRKHVGEHHDARVKAAEARFENEGGGTAVGVDESITNPVAPVNYAGEDFDLSDGAIVIAAITSCTNTSNPAVMLGAGLLARNAVARGLRVKPWVKTSLGPGSRVVSDYFEKAGLMDDLEALGFNVVGYGCTTCIGNSGPLPAPIEAAIREHDLVAVSVLSGNRNFEGRVHAHVKMNYLASPPLVVAYALAGRMDVDLTRDPLGEDRDGNPVYLRDIWPTTFEVQDVVAKNVTSEMFRKSYSSVFKGDDRWNSIDSPEGEMFDWQDDSTYVQNPPYFRGMTLELADDPRDHGCPLPCETGRFNHDGPHFPGRRHQGRLPCRRVPEEQRRAES